MGDIEGISNVIKRHVILVSVRSDALHPSTRLSTNLESLHFLFFLSSVMRRILQNHVILGCGTLDALPNISVLHCLRTTYLESLHFLLSFPSVIKRDLQNHVILGCGTPDALHLSSRLSFSSTSMS